MPIQIEEGKTPKGKRYMRALVRGQVSLADAQAMGALLQSGQPYHQELVLCLVEKDTVYHPDARKHFGTMRGSYKRMGTVVSSALMRASINFMMRLFGDPNDFRLFNSEAEAMAWLDGA